ncbi:putative uridylyltransferase [Phycisphaerae bacterium RAS1]|nr:putative uridylyltransferase [Phycisphaerae bacterium RAS1]
MSNDLDTRAAAFRNALNQTGQSHLLAFWNELPAAPRAELLDDLEQVNWSALPEQIEGFVRRRPVCDVPADIEPAPIHPIQPRPGQEKLYTDAADAGRAALRAGQVAAFMVAGGQGTRLGFDGPKGAFRATPIRSAPLFQIFAEALTRSGERYGRSPRWYIMTSPQNDAATRSFFDEHDYFGFPRGDVRFFRQGQMPAFLPDGRIALAEKHRLALSPDGHGGSLRALAASGALAEMQCDGVEFISYFQVDNPLVRVLDPLFIGLHIVTGSEMSSKAVTKADDLERVGNFCRAGGRIQIIEYSDLPDSLARSKNPDGTRRLDAGSIAIHMLSRDFVQRLTAAGSDIRLPWHRADKKVETIDAHGNRIVPTSPNAVKLEMFVFDAIPLARNPLVLYTSRAEEFSPIKNADGVDSPATARRDMIRRAAGWLESCGRNVPRDTHGKPLHPIEITPRLALDAADLAERLGERRISFGGPLLLDA